MLKRLYEWTLRLAGSRHAGLALFAVAFGESFVLPIPPDAVLAPMVLARPDRAWRNTAICVTGSVLGGLVGYYIGFSLEPVARWILIHSGHAGAEASVQAAFAKYGVVVVLAGVAPLIPFPVITLSSGLAHFSFWPFIVTATIARAGRFAAVTAIVKRFGPTVLLMMERRLVLIAGGVVVLGFLVFAATRLIHP
jgi:membrane protein YqaA with SNARE-associated domain